MIEEKTRSQQVKAREDRCALPRNEDRFGDWRPVHARNFRRYMSASEWVPRPQLRQNPAKASHGNFGRSTTTVARGAGSGQFSTTLHPPPFRSFDEYEREPRLKKAALQSTIAIQPIPNAMCTSHYNCYLPKLWTSRPGYLRTVCEAPPNLAVKRLAFNTLRLPLMSGWPYCASSHTPSQTLKLCILKKALQFPFCH